jgi:predicted nucleic acid-binding protein
VSAAANSSPLILFAKTGHLELLRGLYGEILVPPAVYHEVVERGAGRPGAAAIARAEWILVRAATKPAAAEAGLPSLGAGEVEAIALAAELGVLLIMDDQGGRTLARRRGLTVTGSGGVLLAAKRRGLVATVAPLLAQLVHAGLHLDAALHRELLRLAGE